MTTLQRSDRVYERIVSLWGRVLGRPRLRRLHNLMFNLAARSLGVGSSHPDHNGERRALAWWLKQCGSHPVVWDVGANEGDYVEMIRSANPVSRIVAFEPNPPTYARLAARWSKRDVQCVQCALGAMPGEIELWDYTEAPGGSSHATFHPAAVRRVTGERMASRRVSVRTLDEMAAELMVTHIDLLKIDVEGHELACLEGAAGLLAARRIAAIQFEFNSMHLDAHANMWDFADRLSGYRLYRILPHGILRLDLRDAVLSNLYGVQNILAVGTEERHDRSSP